MALFSLDIQKSLAGEFWTNRYILELASLNPSDAAIASIIAAERAITADGVSFVNYRLSTVEEGDDSYSIVPLGVNGQRAIAEDGLLPLFCVARVDFGATTGRPSRKYLRGVLIEGDQDTAGVLNSTVKTFIDENYTAYLVALEEYVDVDGQALISGAVHPNVGMRQLRRGSKRKTLPVI